MNGAIPESDHEPFDGHLRQAWRHYADLPQLSRSPLAQTPLVTTALLPNDERVPIARGYALRVALDWGLDVLRKQATPRALQSCEVIEQRYINRLSASAYADLHLISDATAQARRRAAIKRLAAIWQTEQTELVGHNVRQQHMIALRYAMLSAEQQRCLRFFAIFNQPIVPAAFADRAQLAPHTHLPALVYTNLVSADASHERVQLFTPVRSFLTTQIKLEERLRWHALAADYFEQAQQLLSAVNHNIQAQRHQQAAELLMTGQSQLGDTLPVGAVRDYIARLMPGAVSPAIYARLKLLDGQAAEFDDDIESAIVAYRRALRAKSTLTKAQACFRLAAVYYQQDIDASLMQYAACRRILTGNASADAQRLRTQALIKEAWISIEQRPNLPHAERLLAQASEILELPDAADWVAILAEYHKTRGILLGNQARWEDAAQEQWQAWQYAQEANDLLQIAQTTHNLGSAHFSLGNYERARGYYQTSQQLAVELGNEQLEAINHKGLGYCAFGLGQYERAMTHYQTAYAWFAGVGNQNWLSAACYDLTEAALLAGRPIQARRYLEEGKRRAEQLGNWALQQGLNALAEQFVELGTPDLSDRQRLAISYIRQNDSINNAQYRQSINCSKNTAERDLNDLIKRGIVQRIGRARATRYVLSSALGRKF